MSTTATVTLVVSISLALLGYIATYRNNLRLDRHKDRLTRVDDQLSNLYGPLFALIRANRRAWDAFRKDVRPGVGEDFWGPVLSQFAEISGTPLFSRMIRLRSTWRC
jgi:hypothetical protein